MTFGCGFLIHHTSRVLRKPCGPFVVPQAHHERNPTTTRPELVEGAPLSLRPELRPGACRRGSPEPVEGAPLSLSKGEQRLFQQPPSPNGLEATPNRPRFPSSQLPPENRAFRRCGAASGTLRWRTLAGSKSDG